MVLTISSFKRWAGALVILATLAPGLAGCGTTNPATGKSDFTPFMSPRQEAALGKKEHPKIIAQYGGVYGDPELADYVARVGRKVLAKSDTPDRNFTFTVLDTPVVNAFALPGGYVYITRGLLALANSEAELAGVLGHEIGHVSARHSAKRYNKSVWASLGAGLLGAVAGSSEVQDLANLGSSLYLSSYSRKQEYQADTLGVRYLASAGYDPFAQAAFLAKLERSTLLERRLGGGSGGGGGGFFATHPRSADRVSRAVEAARKAGGKPGSAPRYKARYLTAIDGLLYGDDPKEGLIRGRVFAHPKLGFTFTVPPGFQLINSDDAVIARANDGALVMFNGARVNPAVPMVTYLRRWAAKTPLANLEQLNIHGLEAATATTRLAGGAKVYDMRLIVIRFKGERIYRFQIATPPAQTAKWTTEMQRMTYSFRRLTGREAAIFKPYRVKIVTVKQGDTVKSLARRMALKKSPVAQFRVLNGLSPTQSVTPGQLVKIIAVQ